MNQRCKNPNSTEYKNYGGKGIRVCDDWNSSNKDGFKNFKKWMLDNGYDESLERGMQTVDRRDGNKNYCPDNCHIISNFEQQANTSRNIKVTYKGETHHIAEWARILGISKDALAKRLRRMSVEDAFITPLKKTNTSYQFTYNGKFYDSLTEVAKDYGLDMKHISYLIHKGLSVNEAIENGMPCK